MDAQRFDSLATTHWLSRPHRRRPLLTTAALGLVSAGVAHGLVTPVASAKHKPKSRNFNGQCRHKNWCLDHTQTCGPGGANAIGKCLIGAHGGNICGEILFQAQTCDECQAPHCTGCRCVLAAGGGNRCNNGVTGADFICVRPLGKA